MKEINIIIEPHFDDAWLSMGNYILKNKKEEFVIISVAIDETNNNFNMKGLMQWCPNIVKMYSLMHYDYGWKQRETQVLKTYEEYCEQNTRYLNNFGTESKFIAKNINDIILKDFRKYFYKTKIFLPIGMQNPMHVIVANLPIIYEKNNLYLYQDVPYAFKNKFVFLIPEIVKNRNLELIYENDGSNNKKKLEIFNFVYSKQFFLRQSCESSKEKIYKKGE